MLLRNVYLLDQYLFVVDDVYARLCHVLDSAACNVKYHLISVGCFYILNIGLACEFLSRCVLYSGYAEILRDVSCKYNLLLVVFGV